MGWTCGGSRQEVDDGARPVYYAAARPTCELQPYPWDLLGPGVRG